MSIFMKSNNAGRGWEEAYKAQALSKKNGAAAPLWQEEAIPFLRDANLIALLKSQGVVRVLDAGAGDARNSFALAREGFFVVGLDIAPTAVELAAQKAVQEGNDHVMFTVGDVTRLNLAGPFDLVVSADTLGQLDDPRAALDEFRRVLKPGGFLVCNLYSTEDGTYGAGRRINEYCFEYKNCTFHYFNESMAEDLVQGWTNVSIQSWSWTDPPHGDFRPQPHRHHSFVVFAQKPEQAKPRSLTIL